MYPASYIGLDFVSTKHDLGQIQYGAWYLVRRSVQGELD